MTRMARRPAPGRVSKQIRDAAPALESRSAWETLGAISGDGPKVDLVIDDEGATKTKVRDVRNPCSCPCKCGATVSSSVFEQRCYLCSRGAHHKCGRHCKPFDPETIKGVGQTQYIPARRACDGGNDGVI